MLKMNQNELITFIMTIMDMKNYMFTTFSGLMYKLA